MKHKFEKFCKNPENIENYEKALADNFNNWDCHHRLGTHTSDGERRQVDISKVELITLDMYYNRPAEELIFLPSNEHTSLHKKGKTYFKGKHHTEEAKNKISEAQKGENNSMYGKLPWNKGKKMSEEYCRKNSESHKGLHWYNNSEIEIKAKECPDGFTPGRLRK